MLQPDNPGEDLQIVLTTATDDDRIQFVLKQIRAYNDSQSQYFRDMRDVEQAWQPFALFLQDESGRVMGGVLAHTNQSWGWMTLAHLWVDESLRDHGHGTELILRAEEEARSRGCRYVEVQTWSFQAPEFYEKVDYRIVGRLDDNPPGFTRFWLRKDL